MVYCHLESFLRDPEPSPRVTMGSRGDFRGVPGFGHIGHYHSSIGGDFLPLDVTRRVRIHEALDKSARILKIVDFCEN